MKIYTKTGDEGETSLFGGVRVRKDDPRVAAYGGLDELNATLGLARSHLAEKEEVEATLDAIQKVLFGIGGEIATASEGAREKLRGLVTEADVVALEESIDRMEAHLPELRSFILPGGSPAGAALHVGRTVCRRAERAIVSLSGNGSIRPEILRYLNRLSDWLFVAARFTNQREGAAETPW